MKKIFIGIVALFVVICAFLDTSEDEGEKVQSANTTQQVQTAAQSQTTPQGQTTAQGQQIVVSQSLVVDEAKIMTSRQQVELQQKLEQISQAHNIKVAVVTIKHLPQGMSKEQYAEECLLKNYSNKEQLKGSMLLLQVTGERVYRICTDPQMRQLITDGTGIPYIQERIVPSLKEDNYYAAYTNFADNVNMMMDYYEAKGEPYDPFNEFSWFALFFGVLGSSFIGYVLYTYLAEGMSNVRAAVSADDYYGEGSLQLSHSSDTYLYTTTTVVRHSSSDDSSDSDSSDSGCGGGGGSY